MLTSDERTELAQLRREHRRLQQDVDILKRTTLDSDDQRNAAAEWVDRLTRRDGTSFATSGYLAAYAGLAPVTRRSGSSIRGEHPAHCVESRR